MIPNGWLGYLAASLTTLSFVPQALLTLRTREVHGISAVMWRLHPRCGPVAGLRLAAGRMADHHCQRRDTGVGGTILATKLVVERRGG